MTTRRMFLGLAAAAVSTGMLASNAQAAAKPRQLLFFNHTYGVLDTATADAIENSAYLREFANFQLRTTTGAQGTWTGRYLMGRETYLELFKEGDLPGQDAALGSAGTGLSVERHGELQTVTDRLPKFGVAKPIQYQQTRDFGDGKPIPWFDAVFTTETYDSYSPWGMEYEESYFADPRSKTEPASFPGDVGRERYLNDDYAKHQMRDVSAIRLGVTATDLANTVPLLQAGGFTVRKRSGGVDASGGTTTLHLDSVPRASAGLHRVDLVLNKPASGKHTEKLGNSTLVVGPGPCATWTFPTNS